MFATAGKDVLALEPETGKELWRFTAPALVSRRGVAYWPGDATTPPRLFSGAGDRLLALEATDGAARDQLRRGRLRRPEGEHPRRRRRRVQPGLAADRLQGHRHHRRQQRRAVAQLRALRRRPRLGRAHGPAPLVVPHGAAGRRARRGDVGRRELEEPLGREHVVVLHGRRRARPRLRAPGIADGGLLRRRPQGGEPLRQRGRRPGRQHRPPEVAPAARPPRPVGLRPARRADARRGRARRPHDSCRSRA